MDPVFFCIAAAAWAAASASLGFAAQRFVCSLWLDWLKSPLGPLLVAAFVATCVTVAALAFGVAAAVLDDAAGGSALEIVCLHLAAAGMDPTATGRPFDSIACGWVAWFVVAGAGAWVGRVCETRKWVLGGANLRRQAIDCPTRLGPADPRPAEGILADMLRDPFREVEAVAMADGIAKNLSGLFRELADGEPVSRVAGVGLAGAEASGRAARLYIFQCDSDDLSLVSTFRRWWVADAEGFRRVEQWPLTPELIQSERFGVEFPYVRFGTDGRRVRFGMRFGQSWYEGREGPLMADGGFDAGRLVDPYPRGL